jgi:hypothetical protein
VTVPTECSMHITSASYTAGTNLDSAQILAERRVSRARSLEPEAIEGLARHLVGPGSWRLRPLSASRPFPSRCVSRSERVEVTEDADVLRQALPLVVEPSELAHFDVAQRRPVSEEKRHALVTSTPGIEKLAVVQQ